MSFWPPPAAMPPSNGKVLYRYFTRDGGPPNDGKPPSPPPKSTPNPPGFPPMMPPFALPQSAAPPYTPTAPPGFACFPLGNAPQQPPPAPGCFWFQGNDATHAMAGVPAFMSPAGSRMPPPTFPQGFRYPVQSKPRQPGDGNRINGHIVKTDNGVGVLTAEENTTFHVLNPEYDFANVTRLDPIGKVPQFEFEVVLCDSTWTVKRLIERLGGTSTRITSRFGAAAANDTTNVAIEEWFQKADGTFERGSCILYNDPRTMYTLKDMGWGSEHGKAGHKPPIWVMLYP